MGYLCLTNELTRTTLSKVWKLAEDELIQRVKMQDNEALHYLYKSNYPSILHFIKTNNGNEQDAKDVYQEAFIIFIENLQKEDFALNCRAQTYIYSICRKKWLKQLSSKGRYGFLDEQEDITDPGYEDDFEGEKQIESMKDALLKLGEPCKGLIEGFYFQKLSMQDISSKFGYTNADNAKNQKYKCLVRLKKLFFEHYKETA